MTKHHHTRYARALFALDPGRGVHGIRQAQQEGLFSEPVAGDPCPKGLKLRRAPAGQSLERGRPIGLGPVGADGNQRQPPSHLCAGYEQCARIGCLANI